MNRTKNVEWYLLSFLLLIVGVIFWQIYTDMTEAGIASGGPYDNAASYPRGLAVILAILVSVRFASKFIQSKKTTSTQDQELSAPVKIWRAVFLLVIFALYLFALGTLGYHLTTPVFLVAILCLTGERKWWLMIIFGIITSIIVSYIFEVLLKIVLPGGIFQLNIHW